MAAATEEALSELHSELAGTLREAIKGEPVLDEDGKYVGMKVNAAALNVARQFLKDNNIQATRANKQVKSLLDGLPDFDSDPTLLNFVEYSRVN